MFESNVPKRDLDKFYSNCKQHNMSGILCNVTAGICNKKQFEIEIFNKNIYVFVSNYNFDPLFITTAIDIIYHIYDIIKIKDSNDNITLDIDLFNDIKQEYDFFLKNLHSNLDQISLLVKNIKNDSLVQLKQFLSQKVIKKDEFIKEFFCDVCKTKFTLKHSLKRHLKKFHNTL